MRSLHRYTWFLALFCILAATAATAQTTGAITGTVSDASGQGLPGVTVEVRGVALQGSKTAVTGRNGEYRFPSLSPGSYTITFALAGFGKTQTNAQVFLDKNVVADATLQISAQEDITVTGEAPVIDATSSSTGTNFTADFLKTLPIGRGFQSVATKTPGVIQGFGADANNFNVQGATGAENAFIIDGVDTTEIQYGRQGKAAPSEFIQEIEVKAGGYSAEYGHAQGGVLNAITKQGGNSFHGDVFGYFAGRPGEADSGNFWQAKDDNLQAKADSLGTVRAQTDPIRNTLRNDYGADLGGYFMKDRIWFFGAYDRVHQDQNNFLNDPVGHCSGPCDAGPGTGTLTGQSLSTVVDQDLFAGKLTFQVLEGLSIVGSIFGDPTSTGPNLATPIAGADPGTYLGTLKQGGTDYTGRLTGVVKSSLLFELQGALHAEKTVQTPDNSTDRRFITVTPSGVPATGGFGFHRDQSFNRTYFRTAATYFANLAGTHEFKVGGDYAHVSSDSKRVYTGPAGMKETVFVYNTAAGPVYQHEYNAINARNATGDPIEVDIAPGGTVSRTKNTGVFAQDRWQVLPELTLNLGIRWEDQKVKDVNNRTQIHINDEWMPRVGFAWDFAGGGRSRLYGNYSRFYQTMPSDINIRAYGLEVTTAVYNFDPNSAVGDPAACLAPYSVCAPGTNPANKFGSSRIKTGGSFGEPTQPGLQGQFSDNITLGVQYEIVSNLSVGVEALYRDLGRVVEDGGVLDSNGDLNYFIFNPGTVFTLPGGTEAVGAGITPPKRYYRALQFTAQKRFSNQLQFLASYVLSKLEGDYDGVFQTSTGQLDPNINSAYDYPIFQQNARGYLTNDRRHVVKLDGSYITPFRLTLGLSAFYYSGTPLNRYGYYNDYRNYELFLLPRGTVGRTPSIYDADLHIGYLLPLGPVDFNVGLDVFNVLNLQRTGSQDQRFDLSGGDPPGENPGTLNPNYLQPVTFTGRRNVRIFGKVSF